MNSDYLSVSHALCGIILSLCLFACPVFLGVSLSFSQSPYPKKIFNSPLEPGIPLILAGNFGEIRNNHFHGGIDIKTMGVEGKKVFSAADGYVSRIKYSPGGYGKALYISHRNGFITVYAHLKRLNDVLEQYVKNAQYANESFEIELFPKPDQFKVKQGEWVAYSGNTGGSTAPHLHFEVRKTGNEDPVNPLLFGFDIPDTIPPLITEIMICPLDSTSHVNGSNEPFKMDVIRRGGILKLRTTAPIAVYGKIGFAIEGYDQLNPAPNRCGLYSVSLSIDSAQVYLHEMETFAFSGNRFINTHVDFYQWKKHGEELQRSFLEPNNNLTIYKNVENRGIVSMSDERVHDIRYTVKDAYGNSTELNFAVQGKSVPGPIIKKQPDEHVKRIFYCDQPNTYRQGNLEVFIPGGSLYNDIPFGFFTSDTLRGGWSPEYHIHNPYTPIHSGFRITVKALNVPAELREHTAIFRIPSTGSLVYEGGVWNGYILSCESKSFGNFTVYVDSVPPEIKPINIRNEKNMRGEEKISFKVDDLLSGIRTYSATIDGKWVLMEYDPKISRVWHEFDDRTKPGEHFFELSVTDYLGNRSIYQAKFSR